MFRFRGKTEKGEWVEGYLSFDYEWYGEDKHKNLLIQDEKDLHHNIISESLSMSTGIFDKTKKEIFGSIPLENGETSRGGDILKNQYGVSYLIFWDIKRGRWGYKFRTRPEIELSALWLSFENGLDLEIIGNQFDGLEKE
jgi:hypothetical protein